MAAAIDDSRLVIFFVSSKSSVSAYCLNEIAYALDAGKPVLAVYIEPVELQGGLKLSMSRTHAILQWQLKEEEYRGQLRLALESINKNSAADQANTGLLAHGAAKQLQKIWLVPLHRNLYFAGRDYFLDEINSVFESASSPTILALTGLGGVGKSQLALEYTYQWMNENYVVAWIRAESPASIEADFVALATALGLPDAVGTDMQLVFAAVHAWLEMNDNWFLVLDNVEGPETVRSILPRNLRGNVLLTTRYQGWRSLAQSILITPFGASEAREFVMNRTGQNDVASASSLAGLLGGLPLALEEACAYMDATGRSVAGYLRLFESHHNALLSRSSPGGDYPATLQTTWEVSFLKLENTEPAATRLLNMLAFLGPDDVPESLLLKCDLSLHADVPRQIGLDDCLARLRRYSLIKVDHDAISVHRLVQLVTRDRLSEEQRKEFALKSLELVEKEFPISGSVGDMLPDCGRLLPHAIATMAHAEGIKDAATCIGRLLGRTGTYQAARGSLQLGGAQLEKAYGLFLKQNNRSPDFAHACELYGRVKYQSGDLDGARTLVEQAITILDEVSDPAGLNLPRCLTLLAWVCWSNGDAAAARKAAERSTHIVSQQTSMQDPRIIAGQSVLGRILMDEGKVDEAVEVVDACVSAIGVLGGARHPIMCGAFLQVAQVLLYVGLPLRAQSWVRESLSLGGPAYGEHHPLVAGSHCILGQVLVDLGEFEAAIHEFNATIESVRRTEMSISQYSALAYSHLIHTLLDLGRNDDANSLLEECLSTAARRIAGDSAHAQAHAGLMAARISNQKGDNELAINQSTDADGLIQSRYGEQHVYRVPALLNTGQVLRSGGQVDEAEASLQLGLQLLQDNGLTEHPQAAACLCELARVSDAADDSEAAQNYRLQAVTRLRACTGPSSLATRALEEELAIE